MDSDNIIQVERFKRKGEELTADVITVKLNEEERKLLEEAKKILEQEKDSTALKQLAWYAAEVLRDKKTSYLLETVFANKRRNKRLGIITYE